MSIGNKSPELKAERGYTNPKSFVRPDGSECLFGEDWIIRKGALLIRAQGQCEYEWCPGGPSDAPMNRCTEDSGDPCHDPMPRHPKRDDRLSNLKFYCRRHHILTEPQREKRWLCFGEGRGESADL